MPKFSLKILRLFAKILLVGLGMIFLYLLYAFLGIAFPKNADYTPLTENGIEIYVITNGFHTDLVFPLEAEKSENWFDFFNQTEFEKFRTYQYLAVGWGDAGFYKESYGGAFPSTPTILKALFLPTPTLMHVDFYKSAPKKGQNCTMLRISEQQYGILQTFIRHSFQVNSAQKAVRSDALGYTQEDFFFEAKGSYHLFQTCNDWTNEVLAEAGFKMPRCAPFSASVFFYLP